MNKNHVLRWLISLALQNHIRVYVCKLLEMAEMLLPSE